MNDIIIERVTPELAMSCIDGLADLLIDCVEGGASVGFMLPLARETARRFFTTVCEAVTRGERVLLIAHDARHRIVGTVQLITHLPDNQPHRGDVAKMLVHREVRRRGVAAGLLRALDVEARNEGRTLLVLDAVTGGDAERLYQRAGWQRVGVVPKYALMPAGQFCSTTFMFKDLEPVVQRSLR